MNHKYAIGDDCSKNDFYVDPSSVEPLFSDMFVEPISHTFIGLIGPGKKVLFNLVDKLMMMFNVQIMNLYTMTIILFS